MSGDPISHGELLQLFEAARWAPSASNQQPWRFLYAHRATPHFQRFYDLLSNGNKTWCHNAAVLLCVCSYNKTDTGKDNRTHSFDTGTSWSNLAHQASLLGLVAHGMGGFDYERARTELRVPDDHTVECMVAIGRPGRAEDLVEKDRVRESPSQRRPVTDFIFEGGFLAPSEDAGAGGPVM